MNKINKVYINGEFVTPHGTDTFNLISPVTNELIGEVVLGDETDALNAISAAKEAFRTFSKTTVEQRIQYLEKIYAAVFKRKQELIDVMVKEYGGPLQFSSASVQNALDSITSNIGILKTFEFKRKAGNAVVILTPLGVAALITPWNASNGFICSKLSTAIAAGCTVVIKPSEMSAMQTQLITECLHEAGLPKGVFNIVNGLGNVVGAAFTSSPDIAKISFTGSTIVGKSIAGKGAESIKRITLELGGKSPNILLEDADLEEAIPVSIATGFMNSGQACIAATRLLVPEHKLEEVKRLIRETVSKIKVGNPQDADTQIGPMVNIKQYNRVQQYIQSGIDEGAEILTGGTGKPEGLESGNFVRPTVFVNVHNDMQIAREEIFGPVICVITYKTIDEAVEIANDTIYGLAAYIQTGDIIRGEEIATRLDAGRIAVNGFKHDPLAPFGGFKQSGIGREYGVYGIETYLEPKTILI